MAAVNVTHTVKTPGNVGVSDVPITVRLKPSGFRADDSQVSREQRFVTDGSGVCVMSLEINTDIDAARPASYPAIASWYEATVMLPAEKGGDEVYCFRATAAQSLHDSIIATPL